MANSVLAKMAVQISANTAEFNKRIAETQQGLNKFTNNLQGLAGTIGIAFGVREVANFAFEVSKLAGEAEGVRTAFERLPNSTKLMNDLKEATGGTVSELSLMKRAVQASNFDIDLAALPKLLQFATLRAQQTGQSVDYLVDSIVTGIGRKSKLILDNLGISAVALGEKLKGVSTDAASVGDVAKAVGDIAEESLANMAGFSDNASTKVQKLSASWENVKVAIGDAANSTGLLGSAIDTLTENLNILASKDISFLQKIAGTFGGVGAAADVNNSIFVEQVRKQVEEQKKQEQVTREVDRAFEEFNGNIEAYGKAIESHIYKTELLAEFQKRLKTEEAAQVDTLEALKNKQKELNDQFDTTDINDTKKLNNIANEIIATQALIDKCEELKKVQPSTDAFKRAATSDTPIQTSLPNPGNPFNAPLTVDTDKIDAAIGKQDQYIDAYNKSAQAVEDWAVAANIAQDSVNAKMEQTAQTAAAVGDIIGNSFGAAIAGNQDFASALKQTTGEIIKLFLKQALAGIIASGAKSGGPTPLALGAAAAGVAAISAMFNSVIGSNSGGGISSAMRPESATRVNYAQGQKIEIYGTLVGDGQTLKAVISNQDKRDRRSKG